MPFGVMKEKKLNVIMMKKMKKLYFIPAREEKLKIILRNGIFYFIRLFYN